MPAQFSRRSAMIANAIRLPGASGAARLALHRRAKNGHPSQRSPLLRRLSRSETTCPNSSADSADLQRSCTNACGRPQVWRGATHNDPARQAHRGCLRARSCMTNRERHVLAGLARWVKQPRGSGLPASDRVPVRRTYSENHVPPRRLPIRLAAGPHRQRAGRRSGVRLGPGADVSAGGALVSFLPRPATGREAEEE